MPTHFFLPLLKGANSISKASNLKLLQIVKHDYTYFVINIFSVSFPSVSKVSLLCSRACSWKTQGIERTNRDEIEHKSKRQFIEHTKIRTIKNDSAIEK